MKSFVLTNNYFMLGWRFLIDILGFIKFSLLLSVFLYFQKTEVNSDIFPKECFSSVTENTLCYGIINPLRIINYRISIVMT